MTRTGNFSQVPTAQRPVDVTNGAPFPSGIIPASMISPNGQRLVANYPLPNCPQCSGGNYAFNYNYPMDVFEYVVKLDYYLSNKHQLSWMRAHDEYTSVENETNLATYTRWIPATNQSWKWTYIINPTTVNTFQFSLPGHHIMQGNFEPNKLFITDYTRQGEGINYPTLFNASSAIPSLSVSGYTGLGVTPVNWNNSDRIIFFKEDYSKILRQHTLKVGLFAQRNRKSQDNWPAVNGSVSFAPGSPLYSGNALADALLGNFYSYTEAGTHQEGWFRFTQIEWYATDNWKVNRKLSVDIGARFNYMPQQYSPLHNTVFFSPGYFNPSKAPQIIPSTGQLVTGTGDPVNGLYVGGTQFPQALVRGWPGLNSPAYQELLRGAPLKISPTEWPIGPRAGFAYDLTGNGKTVLRGGFGMVFERVQGNFIFSEINNPPFVQQATIYTGNIQNPAGGTQRAFPASIISFDSSVKVPSNANYSIGIQHKLGTGTLVDVAYVGSTAWSLYRELDLNQLPVGTEQAHPGVNLNALRPYQGYADIYQYDTGANSRYSSLQVQLRKQFRGGGLISAAYTWSKSIDDASAYSTVPMNSYNANSNRGLSDFDRRNIFVLSYVYPLPFWQNQTSWYRKAFGGWQVSGITTVESGLPLNLTIQGDVAGTGVGGQRPNVIGDPLLNGHTASHWFNPAAFALPAAGTFGNLGRNALIGPGMNNWDISAHKFFSFNERVRLQYRVEVFNAPNHVSFWGVATTVGAANFGQVTSSTDPRIFQMALKLLF